MVGKGIVRYSTSRKHCIDHKLWFIDLALVVVVIMYKSKHNNNISVISSNTRNNISCSIQQQLPYMFGDPVVRLVVSQRLGQVFEHIAHLQKGQ